MSPTKAQVAALVDATQEKYGRVDVFCSNAGAGGNGLLTDAANEVWQQQWELHVMSHLYAARAVLPGMIERGSGYPLNTASAAGLARGARLGLPHRHQGGGRQIWNSWP